MINLYVIKKDKYYVKVVNNVPTLVSTLDKATTFKTGEADKYIKNQIKKNLRNQYIVETVEIKPKHKINDIPEPEFVKTDVLSSLKEVRKSIISQLSDKQHEYLDKLQYYDDAILDIRHYIRDESTRLNACQAANVLYRLQRIERKRAEVKCELKRIYQVFDSIDNAISVANEFHYTPYKPRVIENMDEFMRKEI